MERLDLEFYYGQEAEQFTFYRLPKALITDNRFKEVSNNAKLLYGLMLDRMGLSDRMLWSSIFVTLVAKKYLVPAMSPSLHVEWHNHYNYVGAHNCIQHMQSHLLPGRELLPFQTHTGWCTHFSMC